MISEFLFYEEDASKEDKGNYISQKIEIRELIKNEFDRIVLTEVLLDLRKDVSGETQKRLFNLFVDLDLHKASFLKLKSWRWEVVSKGIYELTQMQMIESYSFITRFINDKRGTIRKQAEIATVTLKNEGIIYFLDTTRYKISEWQQLKLLDVLRNRADFIPPNFKAWLTSKNKHVVLFALRLIKYYNQNDSGKALIELIKHKDDQIKEEAIQCLKEFNVTDSVTTLKLIFWRCSTEIKISILDAIAFLGNETDVSFLEQVEKRDFNFSVKSKAISSINKIVPDSILPTKGITKISEPTSEAYEALGDVPIEEDPNTIDIDMIQLSEIPVTYEIVLPINEERKIADIPDGVQTTKDNVDLNEASQMEYDIPADEPILNESDNPNAEEEPHSIYMEVIQLAEIPVEYEVVSPINEESEIADILDRILPTTDKVNINEVSLEEYDVLADESPLNEIEEPTEEVDPHAIYMEVIQLAEIPVEYEIVSPNNEDREITDTPIAFEAEPMVGEEKELGDFPIDYEVVQSSNEDYEHIDISLKTNLDSNIEIGAIPKEEIIPMPEELNIDFLPIVFDEFEMEPTNSDSITNDSDTEAKEMNEMELNELELIYEEITVQVDRNVEDPEQLEGIENHFINEEEDDNLHFLPLIVDENDVFDEKEEKELSEEPMHGKTNVVETAEPFIDLEELFAEQSAIQKEATKLSFIEWPMNKEVAKIEDEKTAPDAKEEPSPLAAEELEYVEQLINTLPKPKYHDGETIIAMRLLDDIEELGDYREIDYLLELKEQCKKDIILDRISEILLKFEEKYGVECSKETEEKLQIKPFSVFEDLYRTCDTESRLIILDEVVHAGDEKELHFLNELLEDENIEIRKKAAIVLNELQTKLFKESLLFEISDTSFGKEESKRTKDDQGHLFDHMISLSNKMIDRLHG